MRDWFIALVEVVRVEERRVDAMFLAVTVAVWAAIAVFSVFSVIYGGTPGVVFSFAVVVASVLVWGKVTRTWIEHRYGRAARENIGELGEEIKRLREAIEELRRSLES